MAKASEPLTAAVMNERLLTRLRLRHLRLLAALETLPTLHQAAAEIGISQPAATQMLREVEGLLQLRLYERHARGMQATPAGQALTRHARYILKSVRAASEALAAQAAGSTGLIRLGGTLGAVTGLVEPALQAYRRRFPGVRLEVVEGDTERLLAGLASGAFQLVLVRQSAPVPPGFRFEVLLRDEGVVVAARSHPAAHLGRVSLKQLAGEQWILPPADYPIRQLFDQLFAKARIQPLVHEVQSTSPALLPTLLRSGRVLAVAPRSVIGLGLQQRELAVLKLSLKLPLEALGAVYCAQDLSAAGHGLLEALRQAGSAGATAAPS